MFYLSERWEWVGMFSIQVSGSQVKSSGSRAFAWLSLTTRCIWACLVFKLVCSPSAKPWLLPGTSVAMTHSQRQGGCSSHRGDPCRVGLGSWRHTPTSHQESPVTSPQRCLMAWSSFLYAVKLMEYVEQETYKHDWFSYLDFEERLHSAIHIHFHAPFLLQNSANHFGVTQIVFCLTASYFFLTC